MKKLKANICKDRLHPEVLWQVSYTISKMCVGQDFMKTLSIHEIFQTKHVSIKNVTKQIELFLEILAKFLCSC